MKNGQCVSDKDANGVLLACENVEPIMADDGSGSDVTIPSFLLFKHDADQFKAVVKNNKVLQVKMSWAIPSPDDHVEWELWTTPTEEVSKNFEETFYNTVNAIGKDQFFTPHYYLYDGEYNQCTSTTDCGSLCTNHGRYCALDPDNDMNAGVSGADVVVETLRRLCIWKQYGATDGVGKQWWEYSKAFLESCDTIDNFPTSTNTKCAEDVMDRAKIDKSIIAKCMSDSGGTSSNVANTLLAGELTAKDAVGVVVVPSVFVNQVAMRGAISSSSVFNAICTGYLDGTYPDVCKKCLNCNDLDGCVKAGSCGGGGGGGGSNGGKGTVSTTTLIISLLVVVGVFGAGGFAYYKKTQKDMRDQVRGILAEYMPLDDGRLNENSGDAEMMNPSRKSKTLRVGGTPI